MTPSDTAHWYLIQTKPRQEARAEEHLLRQHFECYRPLKAPSPALGSQNARPGEALFPGYLFIRLDHIHDNWYPIRSTRGVSRVVTFGGQPTPVRDELIEQLRQRLAMAERAPAATFRPGERVQVSGGGFSDIEAIFVSSDGEERSIILLNLLQREQKVRVPTRYLHCHA
ncbi:transcription/translation regulatory transformer protein RfaH [Pseudomonas stutzeri]|uniref:Transcription antitermination protein RfaH n=1 Tax=Stutzerimonas stutzeri KOS6 TaxID=1218352 RepID=A0A061JSF8_STUST|nr:transcription/translation regulatory transformer protein RfaH [Stutzerimonas stutzeri]EWC42647.1 transcriptional regulator [Stutzerimonas stutzeri KOS6]MBK3869703.1 transcription/translation regulatory transformer protein RfaH [Stutzerimonas stutzeri]